MKRLAQPSNLLLLVAGIVSVVGLMALFALVVVRAHDQESINNRICQVSVDNRASLRLVLLRSRDASLVSTDDRDTKDRIEAFYRSLLDTVPPLRCRDGKPIEVT